MYLLSEKKRVPRGEALPLIPSVRAQRYRYNVLFGRGCWVPVPGFGLSLSPPQSSDWESSHLSGVKCITWGSQCLHDWELPQFKRIVLHSLRVLARCLHPVHQLMTPPPDKFKGRERAALGNFIGFPKYMTGHGWL